MDTLRTSYVLLVERSFTKFVSYLQNCPLLKSSLTIQTLHSLARKTSVGVLFFFFFFLLVFFWNIFPV